ncbi:unnamed protein product, partial [Ectocarpus sp. 13 AM-2016]
APARGRCDLLHYHQLRERGRLRACSCCGSSASSSGGGGGGASVIGGVALFVLRPQPPHARGALDAAAGAARPSQSVRLGTPVPAGGGPEVVGARRPSGPAPVR